VRRAPAGGAAAGQAARQQRHIRQRQAGRVDHQFAGARQGALHREEAEGVATARDHRAEMEAPAPRQRGADRPLLLAATGQGDHAAGVVAGQGREVVDLDPELADRAGVLQAQVLGEDLAHLPPVAAAGAEQAQAARAEQAEPQRQRQQTDQHVEEPVEQGPAADLRRQQHRRRHQHQPEGVHRA
jgi:hypothetical protein